MTQHYVNTPDGNRVVVNAPEGATQAQIVAYAQSQYAKSKAAPVAKPASFGDALGMGARGVMRGASQIAGIVANPLNVAVNTAFGTDLPMVSGAGDQAADALGLARETTDAEKRRGAFISGATGAAIPVAGASSLAARGMGGIAEMLAAQPLAQVIGGGTAGAAGETARQGGASPLAQFAWSLLGGLGGMGATGAVTRLANPSIPSELATAFQRQGVNPIAADLGGTGTRAATGITRSTLGVVPLASASERAVEQSGAAGSRIAGNMGGVSNPLGAGNAAQSGARTFIAETADKGGRLYDAIPIQPDAGAVLTNTRTALADINKGFASNPELTALTADPKLVAYQKALENGTLTWDELKRFRTLIGEKAGQPALQSDTSQQALKGLYGALSEDMRATAAGLGPRALSAFNRANQYWKGRADRIDSILTPLLGKNSDKSGEATFRQIEAWASNRGDVVKLARTLRTLPADEANQVRATIFDRLGTSKPGAQNADGNAFSPATFVTQWNKMTPEAKSALFGSTSVVRDIDDLVKITAAQKLSGQFDNTSKTALGASGLGHAAGLWVNPFATLATMAGELGVGKMLASPGFARWLASSRRAVTPAQQAASMNRLTTLAAGEPAIAEFQARLMGGAANNNGMASAAASTDQTATDK